MKGSSCCLLKSITTLAMSHTSGRGLLPTATECSGDVRAVPFLGGDPNMGTHARW